MKELKLLEAICRGIDPRDDTVLDTPRDPDLDRARLAYLDKLRRFSKKLESGQDELGSSYLLSNQGARWLPEDDDKLKEIWKSNLCATIEELMKIFGRTKGAITSRLLRLGIVQDSDSMKKENEQRKKTTISDATNSHE